MAARWTRDELIALHDKYGSWSKASRFLKVPYQTLQKAVAIHGLVGAVDSARSDERLRPGTEWIKDRAELRRRLEKYGNVQQMETREHIGHSTIRRWIQKHGITPDEWVPNPADFGIKVYSDTVTLTGDWCVTSDYQAPFVDEKFAGQMVKMARGAGIENLLIAGDFVDLHNFSNHPPVSEQVDWQTTRLFMERFVRWLRSAFTGRIVWTVGNHEDRLPRMTQGKLGMAELAMMIGAIDERFEVIDAPTIDIDSPRGVWRVIHPKSTSIVPGAVARKMASKHLKHVLIAHGHHVSYSRDQSGRFECIDVGGLFDQSRIEYLNRMPSTYPMVNQGFVLLRGGLATLVQPDP